MLPVLLCLLGPIDINEDDQKTNAPSSEQQKKIFSLKFIRTLLSEKYLKSSDVREMDTIRGQEEVKSNGTTENLLSKPRPTDEENQKDTIS